PVLETGIRHVDQVEVLAMTLVRQLGEGSSGGEEPGCAVAVSSEKESLSGHGLVNLGSTIFGHRRPSTGHLWVVTNSERRYHRPPISTRYSSFPGLVMRLAAWILGTLGLLLGFCMKTKAGESVTSYEQAIDTIRASGGKVWQDEERPGKPVIGIILAGKKATDRVCELLKL